jgi:putative ABC transport system permease protein
MTSLQTGLMGFSAGVLAVPLGIILAVVLVYVINQRSFGWSMQILLEPAMLLNAVIFAVIAALLAGIYPAYRLSHMMPQRILSEE